MGETSFESPSSERLDSWKEIAAYLNRDVTTVQRWEKKEGMPVYRHVHDKRGSVYALPEELNAWQGNRRPRDEEPESEAGEVARPHTAATRRGWGIRLVAVFVFCAGLAAAGYFVYRQRAREALRPQIRSLAVLPLRNLSGDPAQEYLADGITEELIGKLAGIRELRVTSHTSVLRFKDPKQSVPDIAKALGVDAVVEGSVIREGSRIRVTAQLIQGATDTHLWSETYDREMRDALTLESDLAEEIADKVKVTVTGEEQQRLTATRPVVPEVYESYLKGMYALDDGGGPWPIGGSGLQQGIAYFDDAIAKDPTFAQAYVGLAQAYTTMGLVATGGVPEETRPKAMEAARKALQLDPNLSQAHVLLANALQEEWQWGEAETEYKQAMALSPNDARAHAGYALWLACEGRTDEAVGWMRRARELDPVSISGSGVAWILFLAHRYDDAIREANDSLAVQPNDTGALQTLGFALLGKGQAEDAVRALEKVEALSNGNPAADGILVRAYAQAGRREDALRLLADLKRRRAAGYLPAAAFVNAYLGLGDKEQAFAALEQAFKERSNILQFVKTHPFFDPIRSDPRFVELERRVGVQ